MTKSGNVQISEKQMIWIIIAGFFTAFFLLILGYVIDQLTTRNSLLMEDNFKTLLGIISYGISFGYWLGLSFAKGYPHRESIFYSSFFGTFTIVLTIIILMSGTLVLLFPVIFSVLAPLSLIKSEIIEQERFGFLKKTISVFSEKLSLFVTLFYFISWYLSQFLDITSRYVISLIFSIVLLLLYYGVKKLLEQQY
jgi:hypothetical protein